MRVISTFLPPEAAAVRVGPVAAGRPSVVMAFDTLVGEKRHVVGLAVGIVDGPDLDGVRLGAFGQIVLQRCLRHHQLNYPQGIVVVAGVAQVAGAVQRTRQVLAHAPDQSLVLLVCRDNKVYDAVFPGLHVDLQPPHFNTQ